MRREPGATSVFPAPESQRPTVVGERYVVSAGHPLVADVAARVFERGGNAIDAGVAAGLAANVVQADMCNFGGVAPILVRRGGEDAVHSVEGLGWWSEAVTVEGYRDRYGDDMPLGAPVAIVPAAPAAWIAALAKFGTLTFAEAAAPAVELAREGFPLDVRLAQSLAVLGGTFRNWESSRQVFWPAGEPPQPGDRIAQPELADLLEHLAAAERGSTREDALEQVRRAFYEGEPARRIVEFVTKTGGWMTAADLAEFRAETVPAIGRRYHDHDVFVGGPWCQGPALLQALAILEHFDLPALGHNSADYVHTLTEAIKLAFWDREHHYGDPRFVDSQLDRLLSDEHAAAQAARIGARALAVPDLAAAQPRRADTTYLCTADAEGNAFSATISDTLDGGPIVPGLGILVSPRGVQSRLDPAHPAALGPRKRPRLTPAPAIALRDGAVTAFGSPGGDAILQAMLQAFLNRLHFGMTPQQALEAPRFVSESFPNSFHPHAMLPGRLDVEERIEPATRAALAERGHDVATWPPFEFDAGSVGLVTDLHPPRKGRRVLAAAADPRRIGYAQGR